MTTDQQAILEAGGYDEMEARLAAQRDDSALGHRALRRPQVLDDADLVVELLG